MEGKRKPRRVATEDRVDIRVSVDRHMGSIFTILTAVPGRVRGRELLALARAHVDGYPAGRAIGVSQQALPSGGTPVAAAPESGMGLDALSEFADATPPMH